MKELLMIEWDWWHVSGNCRFVEWMSVLSLTNTALECMLFPSQCEQVDRQQLMKRPTQRILVCFFSLESLLAHRIQEPLLPACIKWHNTYSHGVDLENVTQKKPRIAARHFLPGHKQLNPCINPNNASMHKLNTSLIFAHVFLVHFIHHVSWNKRIQSKQRM